MVRGQVVIYGDIIYQNAKSHDELAPSATGPFQTPGQVTLAIPPRCTSERGGASGNPDIRGHSGTADAFNPFNPFNQIISGASRARLLEFGNRLFDNQTDSFLVTLGCQGRQIV